MCVVYVCMRIDALFFVTVSYVPSTCSTLTQPSPTNPTQPTQLNPTQPNPTQPNSTQPIPTQPNPTHEHISARYATHTLRDPRVALRAPGIGEVGGADSLESWARPYFHQRDAKESPRAGLGGAAAGRGAGGGGGGGAGPSSSLWMAFSPSEVSLFFKESVFFRAC